MLCAGPPAKKGGGQQSDGGGGVDSEGRSEGEDKEREGEGGRRGAMGENHTAADVLRKKKTPTQLRRERKKRQREREKRQRDLEKMGSEESDVQVATPPPLSPSQKTNSPSPAHKPHPPAHETVAIATHPPAHETVAIATHPLAHETVAIAMAASDQHAGSVATLRSLASKVATNLGSLESESQSSLDSSL